MKALAQKVIRVCRELALCSEEPGRTTRAFLSPPMHEVHRILGDWMREIGMDIRVDAAGNLRGIYGNSSAPRLMIASHLDTVPGAGAFDGVLGVVMGIALAETRPNHSLEVAGFSEEEGVRYGVPFIGSRAVAGTLKRATLNLCTEEIRQFGLDPEQIANARLAPEVTGYLEFHIEQGPVLDDANLPLAVVDAIVGQSRLTLTFEGHANHAGTTPMTLRNDALAAAAEWISAVERYALAEPGLVATVGAIHVSPNAGNVVPGRVTASLDVRHASDKVRQHAVERLVDAAAVRSNIRITCEQTLDQNTVPMNAALGNRLAGAVEASGYPLYRMASGAGHDAMILAPHVPSAMLFLRSPGGISHHPDESVIESDVAAALEVGSRFLRDHDA